MTRTRLKILLVAACRKEAESLVDLIRHGLRAAPFELIPVVAESVQEAKAKWSRDPELLMAMLDLKMPGETGEETVESGFALLEEFASRPGGRLMIHSGFSEPELQTRARSLGAGRYFLKDEDPAVLLSALSDIGREVADWLTRHSPPQPGPSLDEVNAAAEARHAADRAWFLTTPELWPAHQQQVVAVFDRAVLGEGANFAAAYEVARQRCAAESRPCPSQYDLTFVVVPEVGDPEGPPAWDLREQHS